MKLIEVGVGDADDVCNIHEVDVDAVGAVEEVGGVT